jgi:predicted ATPase/DNA-binding SARP family transcriptional activator
VDTGLEFGILGPLEVRRGGTLVRVGGPRQRALLALLLCHANQAVSRDQLIEELLADQPLGVAGRMLRVQVSRLRQSLADGDGPPRVLTRPPGYLLRLQDGELDLQLFEQRVAAGRHALQQGDPGQAAALLGEAEALWRGRPLADLEFEPFARFEIQRLDAQRLAAAEDRVEAELALGQHSALCPELGQLVAEHPLRERLRGQLMLALYRSGRQAEALETYRAGHSLLVAELAVEPGPGLRRLHEQVLAADPALDLPASVGEAFPLLPSLGGPKRRNNLPALVSSFIGRDAELAAVRRLVGGARLVTLTGAGGAGKTRLALQLAAALADDTGDGVWFADLAPLGDPDLVAVTVADVLGVHPEPGRPVLGTLVEAVGARSLMVVLDNCEHIIGACAKLAAALLRGCPALALLATSREPLGIDGERVYRVPPMGAPADGADPTAIWASEAVRLLADRAAAQGVPLARDEPAAQVAGRICRRLDGIPLALELAAARLRAMPAAELDARLDERFVLLTGGSRAALPRQQTLRAMVAWSWELLTGAEQAVLARLSVFAGGFELAAAEAVATGSGVPPGEVAGHLGALVDKSLVQFGDTTTGPARYRLLETVRQYAAGQLEAQGPAAPGRARIAHRDYYLALAEAAAPHLVGPDQAAWLDRLDAELGNLRAAIAFSQAQPDPAPGLRLTGALRVHWTVRGHAAEGAEVMRALLDAPAAQEATLLRARALAAAADLLDQTGRYAIAGDYCQEALAIARAAGDENLAATLLYQRAWVLLRQGQNGAALPLIQSGLGLARRLGDPHLTGRLLSARSYATYAQGDDAGAAREAAESLRLFRQSGDRLQVGHMLSDLGIYELSAGDLDTARRHLAEALDIARALNARDGIAYGIFDLGLAEYLGGSPGTAEPLFAESLDLAGRTGMKRHTAYTLIGLALAGQSGANPGRSARLHGAADQILTELGHAVEPLEGRLAELDRQRLRAAMGAESFESEYAAGRALTPEQIADLTPAKRA